MEEKKKKGFLDYLADGFKPMKARADEEVADDRAKNINQLEIDMKSSKEDRINKLKKGFYGR